MEMKIDDRIYDLIARKLDDGLLPMEETELSDWLAEDVKHEEVYAEIKKMIGLNFCIGILPLIRSMY